MLAQHARALGNLVAIGGHRAGVARRAQILGGIKAECRRIAKAAGFHAIALGSPGLCRVLNDREPMLFSKAGRKVGALPVKVHRHHGFDRAALGPVQQGLHRGRAQAKIGRIDIG